jgi:hypothetical protein
MSQSSQSTPPRDWFPLMMLVLAVSLCINDLSHDQLVVLAGIPILVVVISAFLWVAEHAGGPRI